MIFIFYHPRGPTYLTFNALVVSYYMWIIIKHDVIHFWSSAIRVEAVVGLWITLAVGAVIWTVRLAFLALFVTIVRRQGGFWKYPVYDMPKPADSFEMIDSAPLESFLSSPSPTGFGRVRANWKLKDNQSRFMFEKRKRNRL